VNFDFEQLETLLAFIEAGSFDGAAIDLGISASAVSQRMKALEKRAGTILVLRSKPVRPTEPGVTVLRYARQIVSLGRELNTHLGEGEHAETPQRITIGVNADSLATWFIDVLRELGRREDLICDLRRGDEHRNAELLRKGEVSGVVTTSADAVQGCAVQKLGTMRYWAVASTEFIARRDGMAPRDWLAVAPVVIFDRDDPLQAQLRGRVTGQSTWDGVATHYVPDSWRYATAIEAGMGWGMLPELQLRQLPELHRLDDAWSIEVPLYWQRWSMGSRALDSFGRILMSAAQAAGL